MQDSACTICAQEHIVLTNIAQTQVGPLLSRLISETSSSGLVNDIDLKFTCIVCTMELLRLQKFLSLVEKSRTNLSTFHRNKMICKAEPEDDDLQNFDCYDNVMVEITEETRAAEIESVFLMEDHGKFDDFVIKSEEVNLKEERDDEDSAMDITDEINEEANGVLLPGKSKSRYQQELNIFNAWRKSKAVGVVNETVILAYLSSLSKSLKASTLWTKFSMLKNALIFNGDVDISRYKKVKKFMKSQYISPTPKHSGILSIEQCRRFLLEASDEYLLCKVVLIFGLYGACRRDELLNLTVDNIEDHGSYILVKMQQSKARTFTSFIIPESDEPWNPYGICKKYFKLRPPHVETRRLFVGYRQGKCVAQPTGMHTIGGVPRRVAAFLGLDHPEHYTGHCFRRSGAKMVAESRDLLNNLMDESQRR